MRVLWVVAALLAVGRAAGAQVNCPWLTVGTAERVLGSAGTAGVKTEVKMLAPPRVEEGRCLFMGDGGRTLEIMVPTEMPRECATGEKVRGVGNEARFCGDGKGGAVVVGRVREMYFRTALAGAAAGEGRRRVELIAEMVAGSLF